MPFSTVHRLITSLLIAMMYPLSLSVAHGQIEVTVINDEDGPILLTGQLEYTNPLFASGVSEPIIILEDQAGFVARNDDFVIPLASQTMGKITSDIERSPFTYELTLPIAPRATLNDVDNDGEPDTGVMIFAVAYWANTFGDAYLEQRDQGGSGWSRTNASVRIDTSADARGEYFGGQLLIFAPDDEQAFPSGFGADQHLFTADDPIVRVPQGYTLVNMDTQPFTFDRSREARVDLYESQASAAESFANMDILDAFDAMLGKLRREYAFTEHKDINWDALQGEYRPRFAEASEANNFRAYYVALNDFLWSIPDEHIDSNLVNALFDVFVQETDGGIGMAMRELSDGRVIANFILEGSPADVAGIQLGAEIIAFNDTPIMDYIASVQPWSAPFSSDHVRTLQQLRYATRFLLGEQIDVTYHNPNADKAQTATLTAIAELDSFTVSSFDAAETGYELPVEYRAIADERYVYVQINDFLDDRRLTIQLWERMIDAAKTNAADAIIIDMRNNRGGRGFLADQMAAYFFTEPHGLGNTGFYNEQTDDFFFDPNTEERFILPQPELRYANPVVLLVGPNCRSACEFFSYDMTINSRATVIGQYPTAGLGGAIRQFFMPGGIFVQYTAGRAVDGDGRIHIEGQGIVPDIVVPVTSESLLSDDDVVLRAAIVYLDDLLQDK